MRSRFVLCGGVLLMWVAARAEVAEKAEDPPPPASSPATAPGGAAATQPASEIVLVRIGDKAVVTQAEFDRELRAIPPERLHLAMVRNIVARMAEKKLFLLYIENHPDLVTDEDLEAEFERTMKQGKLKTREELEQRLLARGMTFAEFRERNVLLVARNKLARRGVEMGKDEESLKKMYEANPDHFNGARVTAKHILISVPVYATPAQREEARAQITRIHDDLVSGKRTWDECVQESHCTTRSGGGLIGDIPRYLRFAEPVAKAAWSLEVGELSGVVESQLGLHVVKVIGRKPPYRDFDNKRTKLDMRALLQKQPYADAIKEMRKKYPVVGVQPPRLPPIPEAPARRPVRKVPTWRPVPGTKPALRPHGSGP